MRARLLLWHSNADTQQKHRTQTANADDCVKKLFGEQRS
jgi:hypothetical protein